MLRLIGDNVLLMVEDPMVARIARAQDAAKLRAAKLIGALPAAVALLKRRGATAVWLFGSLATEALPHADTDVDLAVAGLDLDGCAEALFELEALFGASVDLVPLESANARLRRCIERDGREISHVAS